MSNSSKAPGLRSFVVYHDEHGLPHDALITAVWTPTMVNLVYVSPIESKHDDWGRQIERRGSVNHGSITNVHGNYWRFRDESSNVAHAPIAI